MKLPRPSKKIVILLSVAGVFLIGLVVHKYWQNIFGTPNSSALVGVGYETPPTLGTFEGDAATIDADQNGIPDWKEQILGTSTPITASGESDTGGGSVTTNIAHDIFANAAYSANNGDGMSQEDQNTLVQNLLTQVQSSFGFKPYSIAGLKTIENENPDTLRFYATSFASLQLGMIFEMQQKASAIEQNVAVMGDIYAKEAASLYALKVPAELAATHLEIVNNFSRASASFYAIANEAKDPIEVPVAIQVYQQAAGAQDGLLLQVAQFLKSSGIIFTSDETGGYWNAVESSVGGTS